VGVSGSRNLFGLQGGRRTKAGDFLDTSRESRDGRAHRGTVVRIRETEIGNSRQERTVQPGIQKYKSMCRRTHLRTTSTVTPEVSFSTSCTNLTTRAAESYNAPADTTRLLSGWRKKQATPIRTAGSRSGKNGRQASTEVTVLLRDQCEVTILHGEKARR